MATAWFICKYLTLKREDPGNKFWSKRRRVPSFYPSKPLTQKISCAETLGNHCVVRVVAESDALDQIAAQPGVIRMPKTLLTETVADLSTAQKKAILDKLVSLGYTADEVKNELGSNLVGKTLLDVLRFALKRRLTPRWDDDLDDYTFALPVRPTRQPEEMDK